MIDRIGASHWPQNDVLDKELAEEVQAAEDEQHSVLRTLSRTQQSAAAAKRHAHPQ